MRYDNIDETYDKTFKAGCFGCLIYVFIFFTAGGVLLLFNKPIILSVPALAIYVLIWLIIFVIARKMDKKKNNLGE